MISRKKHLVLLAAQAAATLLWLGLVLYPDPALLARSVQRTAHPPLNPVQVEVLVSEAPVGPEGEYDPRQLELFVRERVPYQSDWITYRVPYYFPTPREVLRHGAGDCKSRLVVLASLLERLEIPYEIRYSPNHFWVHYEGKVENELESDATAFYAGGDRGKSFQLPRGHLTATREAFRLYFWQVMPPERKALFLGGLFIPSLLVRGTAGRLSALTPEGFAKSLPDVDKALTTPGYTGGK